jgi:hypothetical protein
MSHCSWITLLPTIIVGAEGDEPEGDTNEPQGNEGEPQGGATGDTPNDSDEGNEVDEKDTAGLKSALEKERKAARDAQRELKRLQKAEADRSLAEKSDIEKAQLKEQAATERAQRLAAGLLSRDLNDAIRKAANELKFIDTEDAIAGVDRSVLTFAQDEDDPTDITIDAKTVERAVKALAAKKPHFIRSGTNDGQPTGSPMGGSRGSGGDRKAQEAELIKRYPALRS